MVHNYIKNKNDTINCENVFSNCMASDNIILRIWFKLDFLLLGRIGLRAHFIEFRKLSYCKNKNLCHY